MGVFAILWKVPIQIDFVRLLDSKQGWYWVQQLYVHWVRQIKWKFKYPTSITHFPDIVYVIWIENPPDQQRI